MLLFTLYMFAYLVGICVGTCAAETKSAFIIGAEVACGIIGMFLLVYAVGHLIHG